MRMATDLQEFSGEMVAGDAVTLRRVVKGRRRTVARGAAVGGRKLGFGSPAAAEYDGTGGEIS